MSCGNVHDWLRDAADRRPDEVALIDQQRTLTYGALDEAANRFARVLIERKVARGDRVMVALDNSFELVGCYFGAMRAGAVAVPLAGGTRNDRLVKAVEDCSPRASVTDAATLSAPRFAEALGRIEHRFVSGPAPEQAPALSADPLDAACAGVSGVPIAARVIDRDLAAIVYTSGSTGMPRGVMQTHRNIGANTASIVSYLRLTASDRVLCVLPFYYVYGLSLLHTHVRVGGSLVLENRVAYTYAILSSMQQHEVTGFAGVPSTFEVLMRGSTSTISCPSLRYVTQAGGNMAPQRIAEWCRRVPGVAFYVMYGASEATARLTYLDPDRRERKAGSIGRAIPNVEILVVRENGAIAGPGEIGELVARGSNITSGYWTADPESQQKFGPWGYRTGDLGYRDEEGFLFLSGRRQDFIKVGAHRVGPIEIEEVLCELAGVAEAAVVGVPHAVLGETPAAFIVATDPALDAAGVLAFCRERLPAHKLPGRVLLRASLPKSDVGKIDRRALRAELVDSPGHVRETAPSHS